MAAARAARRLWQAGYSRVRVTLGHDRPGEPDLAAAPDLAVTAAADMGLDAVPEAPAGGEAGSCAWLTLVTSEDHAPAALRVLRESGGNWR